MRPSSPAFSCAVALLTCVVPAAAGRAQTGPDTLAAPTSAPAAMPDTGAAPAAAARVAEVRIAPADTSVESGTRFRLSAVAVDSAGRVLEGLPFFWGADPGLVTGMDSSGALVAGAPMTGLVIARPVGAPVIGTARVRVLPPRIVTLRLDVPLRALAGAFLPLEVTGTDRTGTERSVADAAWTSSDRAVARVEAGHLVAGKPGRAVLTAASGDARAAREVRVEPNPARTLAIACAACAAGVREEDEVLLLPVGEAVRLEATSPELAEAAPVRWWIGAGGARIATDGTFVAERPGKFVVLAQMGALTAVQLVEATPRERAGVFRLVGRGAVAQPRVSDLWVFEGLDGRDYAYTGSIGGDQVKVWDVTDPANPVQTDSLVVDARVVNDVNLNSSRRIGVLTREGASSRRNGLVFFDASDPAHPKLLSEYTETVTAGVHNAFFDGDYVYATNDGTRALHVISAKDPLHPVEVARWEVRPGSTDKYLHDVYVKDGLAYLSYWDDGLVVLDVGAGVKGGSPESPQFISRIAYPEGHTHTAWRWKNWVFTTDEIFGGPPVSPLGSVPAGFLHVIDVTDLENPVEVAWFAVPGAGTHNVWMDEEREILFVSYYNAGVRALDVSGNLRGDLAAQGRELAYFLTGEPDSAKAFRPNEPMNWGPQVYEGLVYSSDQNSGLWVLEYQPLPGGAASPSAPPR